MFDLVQAQNDIAQLFRDIQCIKDGSCCNGASVDTSIYANDGTFGASRQGTLTDTLEILNSGGKILHTYDNSGDVWFLQSTSSGFGLGLDKTDALTARLNIKGTGNTSATKTVHIEDLSGVNKTAIYDDGARYYGIGLGVTPQALTTTGVYNYINGYRTGLSVHTIGSDTVTSTTILDQGSAVTGLTTSIRGTSAPVFATETTAAARFWNDRTNQTPVQIGGIGSSANGTLKSIGFYGTTNNSISNIGDLESTGQDPLTNYAAGLRGLSRISNTGNFTNHNILIGVYGTGGASVDGLEVVGVQGDIASISTATSNATLVGGRFAVNHSTGTNNRLIALHVPATDNVGTVVIGADAPSANKSMVEITGDLELMNALNGVILLRPDGGRRRITIDNTDTLQINPA